MNNSFLGVAMEPIDAKKLSEISESEPGDSFLQTLFWTSLKSNFGWKPLYFLLDEQPLVVLVRKIGRSFSIVYVPYAPSEKYQDKLEEISRCLKEYLPRGSLFIRYDLPWRNGSKPSSLFKKAEDIQPASTVIIDITKNKDVILSEMKSKTRYNIKLAEKKGVSVKKYSIEMLGEWYEIYRETSVRDKIALHSLKYYKTLFELAQEKEFGVDIRLYMAEDEGKNIAGIVTCFYNKKATYLYGASSNIAREKMPAYALQWKAICDAIDEGCVEYDMFGIPPDDNPSHPMHGLYRFKTGFGGAIVHRPGCYDFLLNKFAYKFYTIAEIARNYYFKKIRKR
ncbi:MAG: peptidoglycan bridge formation glycyltransferase FemA/FemB family protein [Spirochaetes bacterium]|nr:peptidoglycan bridge formation glycyltransferase FemA/FemB family protein [Spirochaetota bacterium]